MNRKSKLALAAAAVAAVCVAAPLTAEAVTAPSPVHHAAFFACVDHNGSGQATSVTGHPMTCPAGSILAEGDKGTTGPAGPAGAPGKDGAPGTSGVVSAAAHDLGAVASVATGGSFAANKTLAGTVSLKAGTYLLSVNAKATPLTSSAVEVFPQFFVYNGAALADFSNDLLNVGSGPLASSNTTIDSYYSGTGVVTLKADAVLNVYAFGYDSDRGAGTYALGDLSVTAVQLQAS
jgi:hypothetical protein